MYCTVSQLGGFNTLMYYSSTLFSMVGFNKPVAVSIVVGGTNFLFGFVNFAAIDRFGRRVVLLITVLGMVSVATKISYFNTDNRISPSPSSSPPSPSTGSPSATTCPSRRARSAGRASSS